MPAFIQRKAKLLLMYARGRVSFARLLRAPPSLFSFARLLPLLLALPCTFPATCEDSCRDPTTGEPNGDWVRDGICDDGGPGHYYSDCALGTDCEDCEVRDGCYIGGLQYSAAALDGGAALQVTMVDADFGKKGRWAPEEGAPVALSHLHGTVLRVADRVDVSGWDGALPRQRPTFNLSAAGAALPAGAGVVRCLSEAEAARAAGPAPPPEPADAPRFFVCHPDLRAWELEKAASEAPGGGLLLNGSAARARLPPFTWGGATSVSLWAKLGGGGGGGGGGGDLPLLELRDAADGAASAAVRVGLTTLAASPSLELVLTGAGGSPRAAANWSLAGAGADAFRHVAVVLTPPLARLYVDGAEHDSSPRSLPPDAFPPAGGESANNTAWPGGNCSPSPPSPAEAILRALAVFPGAALSAEEVRALNGSRFAPPCAEAAGERVPRAAPDPGLNRFAFPAPIS